MPKFNYTLIALLLSCLVVACVCSACGIAVNAAPSSATITSAYTVTAAPTISAKKIDAVLRAAGSPAVGTGKSLYSLGVHYGINPAVALAFFKEESSFGKYGVARVSLSLGNIRCTDGYQCVDGYRAYDSWAAGYEDWYKLISKLYVGQWHLTTISQIVRTYAPSSENDTLAYIHTVEQFIDQVSK